MVVCEQDDGQRLVLRVGNAFKRYHIGKLGVGHDDTDTLGSVHGRTASDGNDKVGLCLLAGSHTVLYICDCGVGLHLRENLVRDASLVHHVRHLLGNAKLDETFVSYHQCLLIAKACHYSGELFPCTRSEVRYLVEDKSVDHCIFLLKSYCLSMMLDLTQI